MKEEAAAEDIEEVKAEVDDVAVEGERAWGGGVSSHWELLLLHWEKRGWVKLQRTGSKLECIAQWGSILEGVYDLGQQASYEGAVEGLTITRLAKPLARAAPATRSPTGPTGAAPEPLPMQRLTCGPPWAPWGPSDQSRISKYLRS